MNQYECRSYLLALLSAVAGFISVAVARNNVKYVCQGDSVPAFQNIEFNNCNANVHLLRNYDRNAMIEIAVWSIQNCIRNESLLPEYQGRLIFDQNGTITIQNFDYKDQATYMAVSKMDPLPKIYEVQLSLMVAPNKTCKPVIEQLGNSLKASLKANDCGKPVAVPYWKDYDCVLNTDGPILKLNPDMEAREYYACIKGPALTCVNNVTSHDYCTKFKPEGSKSPPASLETCNAIALLAVCIILGILLLMAILATAVIFIRYRLKKSKLNWEDIQTLLNDDQQIGFSTYCDNLILQNNISRRKNERQGDVENEASTEHPGCSDPDKIKEFLELRNAILCKICLASKMNVIFLPCTHIAACTKCSSSLPQCPVCRVEIKQKRTICFD